MKQMKQLMKQYPMSLLAGTCCTAILLAFSSAGGAQQAAAPATASSNRQAASQVARAFQHMPVVAKEEQEAASGKPGDQGIKVHGHWVITVKNADGTIAEHRDFQNSLITAGAQAYGSQVMTALLSGNAIPGPPALALIQVPPVTGSTDETTICSSLANNCAIFAAPDSLATLLPEDPSFGPLLTMQTGLTAVANFSAPVGIVLSGNFVAPATGSVTFLAVESIFPVCVPTSASYAASNSPAFTGSTTFDNGNTAPNNCTASYFADLGHSGTEKLFIAPLTYTVITNGGTPAPLTLAPSQTITISFTLSFS